MKQIYDAEKLLISKRLEHTLTRSVHVIFSKYATCARHDSTSKKFSCPRTCIHAGKFWTNVFSTAYIVSNTLCTHVDAEM